MAFFSFSSPSVPPPHFFILKNFSFALSLHMLYFSLDFFHSLLTLNFNDYLIPPYHSACTCITLPNCLGRNIVQSRQIFVNVKYHLALVYECCTWPLCNKHTSSKDFNNLILLFLMCMFNFFPFNTVTIKRTDSDNSINSDSQSCKFFLYEYNLFILALLWYQSITIRFLHSQLFLFYQSSANITRNMQQWV